MKRLGKEWNDIQFGLFSLRKFDCITNTNHNVFVSKECDDKHFMNITPSKTPNNYFRPTNKSKHTSKGFFFNKFDLIIFCVCQN